MSSVEAKLLEAELRAPAWALEGAAEKFGLTLDELADLIRRGQIRYLTFRDIHYFALKRKMRGHREGAVVLTARGHEPLLVEGYPSITRLVLLRGLPRRFPGPLHVEEKMDGYNVRLVYYADRVLGVTRGGLVCPYTTARLERMYGDKARQLYRELDPYKYFLAGEVVGEENPYVRIRYPEAPDFDYFIFDVFAEGKPQPLKLRDEVTEKYGFRRVRTLAVLDKPEPERVYEVVKQLSREGREGVVLKDPEYRVPPAKYTTEFINIHDIEHGMEAFEDEGRSYLHSRLIREVFRIYEWGPEEGSLEEYAKRLGLAIMRGMMKAIEMVERYGRVFEEFTLPFPSPREAKEYLDFVEALQVPIEVVDAEPTEGGGVRLKLRKLKEETTQLVKHILATGVSPHD